MHKFLRRLLYISGVILVIVAFALTIYYNFLLKDHSGPMDWWAIMLIAVPFVLALVLRVLLEFFPSENDSNKNTFVDSILDILIFLFLPIWLVIDGIHFLFVGGNKTYFKKLIRKGYKFERKDKKYYISKNNIIIKVSRLLNSYDISFDGGQHYVRVEESNLGEQNEREELSYLLNEYLNAHPVDIQRGDAVPPVTKFIDFLDKYLE